MPVAMLLCKFYCCGCGARLRRMSTQMTYEPGDPDYKKFSRFGRGRALGAVDVTEYDFYCAACKKATTYDQQRIIDYIQKKTESRCLAQSEVKTHQLEAQMAMARKKRRTDVVVWIITAAVFMACALLALRQQG